jgi:hypothetical protein
MQVCSLCLFPLPVSLSLLHMVAHGGETG